MKKQIAVFASVCIVAIVSMNFVSCTSDEEEFEPAKVEESFTLKDINALKQLKQKVQLAKVKMAKPVQTCIVETRATTGDEVLSPEALEEVTAQLNKVGAESIKTFEALGISRDELEEVCSIDGNEAFYGMMAVEIVDALDTDELIYTGGDCEIAINKGKAISCALQVLGFDAPVIAVGAIWGGIKLGQSIAKKELKTFIIGLLKSVVNNAKGKLVSALAGGPGFTIAVLVAQWTWCYFDLPDFSDFF